MELITSIKDNNENDNKSICLLRVLHFSKDFHVNYLMCALLQKWGFGKINIILPL